MNPDHKTSKGTKHELVCTGVFWQGRLFKVVKVIFPGADLHEALPLVSYLSESPVARDEVENSLRPV